MITSYSHECFKLKFNDKGLFRTMTIHALANVYMSYVYLLPDMVLYKLMKLNQKTVYKTTTIQKQSMCSVGYTQRKHIVYKYVIIYLPLSHMPVAFKSNDLSLLHDDRSNS